MVLAAQAILLVYAVLLAAGGYGGYKAAGSSISLVTGIISALLALAAFFVSLSAPTQGFWMGIFISVLVGLFFIYRFVKTGAVMPAGAIILISVVVLSLCFAAISQMRSGASG